MNPLVSIIIPIYNVEKYVRHCIQSILSQDINHSLVELIIVNDCTLDNSMEIVKEIIGKYKTEEMNSLIKSNNYSVANLYDSEYVNEKLFAPYNEINNEKLIAKNDVSYCVIQK